MDYHVIAPDGQRYGPASLADLNEWARQGRLAPGSQLEESGSGRRLVASEVLGLQFPPKPPPPSTGSYYRPDYGGPATAANPQVTSSWILGAVALVLLFLTFSCCWLGVLASLGGLVCSIVGIVMANRARAQGCSQAQGPWVLNLVALILNSLLFVLIAVWLVLFIRGMS